MPLVNIHVENALWLDRKDEMIAALKPIRAMLCKAFNVDASACQLIILPHWGVDDQAPVAAQLQMLPKPDRTRDVILEACKRLQEALLQAAGAGVVIRSTQLNPETYLVVK